LSAVQVGRAIVIALGIALGDTCLVLLIRIEEGTEGHAVSLKSSSTTVEDESTGLEDTRAVGIEDDRTSSIFTRF
jgi:hypothetical protein